MDQFLDGFEGAARHRFELREPKRFAVLVIGHIYTRGELIPFSFYCLEGIQRVGFRTKAVIVKNIEGNEQGKGCSSNLWRYRALRGGFYIFKHEYVMVFRKPG